MRILILGLGREGLETYRFLRSEFPGGVLGIADRLPIGRLLSQAQNAIAADRKLATHLGNGYLSA